MGCDIHCYLEVYDDNKWICRDTKDNYGGNFYKNRNYALFAWLGMPYRCTHIPPINPCRGIPTDASDFVANMKTEWAGDGHSHSYFTFAELIPYLEIDVTCKVYIKTTFMDYIRRDKVNFGLSEWGNHYTVKLDYVTNKEAYEEVTFTKPLDEFMGDFKDLVKKEAANHKNLEHVRIVFWFDN